MLFIAATLLFRVLSQTLTFDEQVRCLSQVDDFIVVGTLSKKLYVLQNTQILHTLESLEQDPRSCLIVPSHSLVIAGGSTGHIYKWNYVTNSLEQDITIHNKRVNQLKRIPDTTQVISAGYDRLVQKFDFLTLALLGTFAEHSGVVASVTLMGAIGISVGSDRIIRLWDLPTMNPLTTITTTHTALINAVVQTSGVIVTGSVDKNIIFWDANTYELITQISNAHDSDINTMLVITSNVIASGANDNLVKLWNVRNRSLIRTVQTHTGAINSFAKRANSEIFLSGSGDYTVRFNNIKNCAQSQFFLDDCTNCSSACASCFESASNCLTCSANRNSPPICSCNQNYYPSNGTCIQCAHKCLTCLNGSSCNSCRGDRVGAECICASGYDDSISENCQPCQANCLSCNMLGCLECVPGRALPNCLCPLGFYQDEALSCQQCQFKCTQCEREQTCTQCRGDRDIMNECKCPARKYDDGASESCQNCLTYCEQCIDSFTCLKCAENFTLPSCNCPAGYFIQNESCIKCSHKCSTCDINGCLSCRGDRKGSPVCDCEQGFFDDGFSINCQKCMNNCSLCSRLEECSTCFTLRVEPLCVCLTGYFENLNQACQLCPKNCLTCTSLEQCQTCLQALQIPPLCTCQDGYFEIGTTCQPCREHCLTCLSFETCSKCDDDRRATPTCQCKEGFFGALCDACDLKCKTCLSKNECLACTNLRLPPECLCNSNEFSNLANQQCESCPTNCLSCTSSQVCTSCVDLNMTTPSCECNPTFYLELKQCKACPFKCSLCSGLGSCTSCRGDRILNLNCLCPQGYYDDGLSDLCQKCRQHCLNCLSLNTCLACEVPRQGPLCSCPSNQFEEEGTCLECNDLCSSCEGRDSCTTCAQATKRAPSCLCNYGQYLDGTLCRDCAAYCRICQNQSGCQQCMEPRVLPTCSCPDGTYELAGSCQVCPFQCLTCSEASSCLQCRGDRILTPERNCVCKDGQFDDQKSQNCSLCLAFCNYCTIAEKCEKCELLRSAPLCKCSQGLYQDESNKCAVCPEKCLDCEGGICTSCKNPILAPPDCFYCPPRTYFLADSCKSCGSHCLQCQNNLICKVCEPDREPPKCLCADGYYELESLCLNCPKVCKTCDRNFCLSCFENREGPSCECPLGYFSNPGLAKCQKCKSTCKSCASLNDCHECTSRRSPPQCECLQGYFELEGSCQLCAQDCLSCVGASSNCLACQSPDAIPPDCKCPAGFTFLNDICLACVQPFCEQCSPYDQCTVCLSSRVTPLCECPAQHYSNNETGDCIYCGDSCEICDQEGCKVCTGNRALPECKCPLGQYDQDGICSVCSPKCTSCVAFERCSSCKYELSTPPLCDCPRGTLEFMGICVECIPGCEKCDSFSQCLLCKPFREGDRCECQKGYFENANSGKCDPCPPTCKRCTQDGCSQCVDETRETPSCQCKGGFYENPMTGNCELCQNECGKCKAARNCAFCEDCSASLESEYTVLYILIGFFMVYVVLTFYFYRRNALQKLKVQAQRSQLTSAQSNKEPQWQSPISDKLGFQAKLDISSVLESPGAPQQLDFDLKEVNALSSEQRESKVLNSADLNNLNHRAMKHFSFDIIRFKPGNLSQVRPIKSLCAPQEILFDIKADLDKEKEQSSVSIIPDGEQARESVQLPEISITSDPIQNQEAEEYSNIEQSSKSISEDIPRSLEFDDLQDEQTQQGKQASLGPQQTGQFAWQTPLPHEQRDPAIFHARQLPQNQQELNQRAKGFFSLGIDLRPKPAKIQRVKSDAVEVPIEVRQPINQARNQKAQSHFLLSITGKPALYQQKQTVNIDEANEEFASSFNSLSSNDLTDREGSHSRREIKPPENKHKFILDLDLGRKKDQFASTILPHYEGAHDLVPAPNNAPKNVSDQPMEKPSVPPQNSVWKEISKRMCQHQLIAILITNHNQERQLFNQFSLVQFYALITGFCDLIQMPFVLRLAVSVVLGALTRVIFLKLTLYMIKSLCEICIRTGLLFFVVTIMAMFLPHEFWEHLFLSALSIDYILIQLIAGQFIDG